MVSLAPRGRKEDKPWERVIGNWFIILWQYKLVSNLFQEFSLLRNSVNNRKWKKKHKRNKEGSGIDWLTDWLIDWGWGLVAANRVTDDWNNMAVFTLEDEQICPSDVNLCRTVIDLFVSMGKSSWKNCFSRWKTATDCSFGSLFLPDSTS